MKEIKTLVNSLHEPIPEKEIIYYNLDKNGLRYRAYEASLELFLIEQKKASNAYDWRNDTIDDFYRLGKWESLERYTNEMNEYIKELKRVKSDYALD